MIWPFKKREPALTTEQWAEQFPTPPCGNKATHYEWQKINGMVCPLCYADRKRREKDAELDALADKIVARLRQTTDGVPASDGKTVAREAAAPSPHPGWKLVPIEPTLEMIAAYLTANDSYWKRTDELPTPPNKWRTGTPAEATAAGYRAMLAASPQAAAPASEVERDAARYRWLRDENNGDSDITPFFAGQGLDEAIDAAMGVSAPAQQTKEQP